MTMTQWHNIADVSSLSASKGIDQMNSWPEERLNTSFISLLLSLLLAGCVLVLLWGLAGPALAATCNVPSTHATIQAAVDDPGCTIITVAGGTYAERVSITRSLTIRGTGSTSTVLDGGGIGRPLTVRGSTTVVRIEGLRITNGRAIPAPGYGGGVLVADRATLHGENLQIDQNVAHTATQSGFGGGLAVQNATAFLTRTLVLSNTALLGGTGSGYGGGIFVGGGAASVNRAILHLADSEVRGNVAYNSTISSVNTTPEALGGGLFVGASDDTRVVLSGNTWLRNVARAAGAFSGNGDGGAIAVDTGNTAAIIRMTGDEFIDNRANETGNTARGSTARGGAIFLETDAPRRITARLADLTLRGNLARAVGTGDAVGQGGGLYARNSEVDFDGGMLAENIAGVAVGNGQWAQGGAIALVNTRLKADRLILVDNVALQGNGSETPDADSQGGGIALNTASELLLKNSILADNHASETDGNGAGVYISGDSQARLVHVTIADEALNAQAGVYADGPGSINDVVLMNTMIVSHTTGIDNRGINGRVYQEKMLFFANETNTAGPIIGEVENFVEGDPDFLDPAGRSYRIGPNSAAINAGANLRVYTDINGDERPQNGGFDIGADELPAPISVAGVTIDGPAAGPPGEYAFVARTSPKHATEPISYQWDDGNAGALSSRTLETGVYTLTLTVSNNGGAGSATISHTVTITPTGQECPVPLAGVTIAGPDSGETQTAYEFTASINPIDATTPVTYTWSPEPASGQGTASARYTWFTAGTKPVAVTVQNCGGATAASATIDMRLRPPAPPLAPDLVFPVTYLPLIQR